MENTQNERKEKFVVERINYLEKGEDLKSNHDINRKHLALFMVADAKDMLIHMTADIKAGIGMLIDRGAQNIDSLGYLITDGWKTIAENYFAEITYLVTETGERKTVYANIVDTETKGEDEIIQKMAEVTIGDNFEAEIQSDICNLRTTGVQYCTNEAGQVTKMMFGERINALVDIARLGILAIALPQSSLQPLFDICIHGTIPSSGKTVLELFTMTKEAYSDSEITIYPLIRSFLKETVDTDIDKLTINGKIMYTMFKDALTKQEKAEIEANKEAKVENENKGDENTDVVETTETAE